MNLKMRTVATYKTNYGKRPGSIQKRTVYSKVPFSNLRRRGLVGPGIASTIQRGRNRALANLRTGGFLGLELKYKDFSYTGTMPAPSDASGGMADPSTALCLNAVAIGTAPNQRDGKQISMKSLAIRGSVSIGPTTSATYTAVEPPTCFIAVVLDTQTNAAQATSESIFENPSGSSLLAPFVFRNLGNDKRFRVLKTKRISFPATGTVGIAGPVYTRAYEARPFEMYINLRNMICNFRIGGDTAAIGSMADNTIHVVAFSNNIDDLPTLAYNSRLRYLG